MRNLLLNSTALRAKAFLIVCLLTAGLHSCKNNKPATTDEILEKASKAPGLNAGTGTFTVSTPGGWEQKDTVMNGIKFLFMYSPQVAGQMFRPNMNVVTESMGNSSFDEYVKKNNDMMGQYFQQYKELGNGDVETNGMKGKWMRYSHVQNGYTLDNIVYMFSKNGIAYVLTGTTLDGDMNKYKDKYETIAKSLQVP